MPAGGRDTPKDIQDGKFGQQPGTASHFDDEAQPQPILTPALARTLARDCDNASTHWINSGKRARWTESLRAFQGRHPPDSKYSSRDYAYRTNLFRPKTRAMVRKAEAQTASAFFANEDVVHIEAADEDNPQQAAAAKLKQELLQYRLTNSENGIPWFLTLVGARQDCEVMGVCCAKAYWKREDKKRTELRHGDDEDGNPRYDDDGNPEFEHHQVSETVTDKPVVDLIPAENLRIEAGADWRTAIQSSPYIIHKIPMYIADVRALMESGEWHDISESALRGSINMQDDMTRRAREPGRTPGKDNDTTKPREFEIAWVSENIIRWGGQDWHFYSLGEVGELLTDPRPLSEVYLHGIRPFVMGFVVLETHKTYPSSKVELVRDLQRATNDDWNLRFDQMKLSLNPRQFVKQSSGIELIDVRTFMPGKVVMVQDPQNDIVWDRPPEPSAAAYQEQDRINLDFDELVGDFSNTSVQASQAAEHSATGMNLMSGMASGMNEYELRVFAETFVEPLLRLIVKLEEAYETDEIVLAICGKKAGLVEKFGIHEITDELLAEDVTTRVNVGIGATNPSIKMHNFMLVMEGLGKLFGPALAQGLNFEEVSNEAFAMAGYKDGGRFFKPDFDPAQITAHMAQGQQKPGAQPDPYKLQAAQVQSQGKIQERQITAQSDQVEQQMEMERVKLQEQQETQRVMMEIQGRQQETHIRGQHAAAATMQKAQMAAQQAAMRPAPMGQPPAAQAPGGVPPHGF